MHSRPVRPHRRTNASDAVAAPRSAFRSRFVPLLTALTTLTLVSLLGVTPGSALGAAGGATPGLGLGLGLDSTGDALGSGRTSLTLRFVDGESGEPVSDVDVYSISPAWLQFTDDAGETTFFELRPGSYSFLARRAGYVDSDTLSVDLTGLDAEIARTVRLTPFKWLMDQVVVTGTRSPHLLADAPVQTELLTPEDFKKTGAATVDQALQWSAGVDVQDDLSGQGAMLRGISGDRVLVLVDGVKTVGRVRGSIDLSQLDLARVGKVEIVKGTGSTLYGSEAMGGVVHIITRDPEDTPSGYGATAHYGTHRTTNFQAEIAPPRGKNSAFDFGFRLDRTNGFDLDPSTPHTNGQEEIFQLGANASWAYRFTPQMRLRTNFAVLDENRDWVESEILGGRTFTYDDEELNRRYTASTTLQFRSGEAYDMNFRLAATTYDHKWYKRNFRGDILDRSLTEDRFFEAAYSSNYGFREGHTATYGFDFNFEDLTSTELDDAKKATRTAAGYLQYEYSPHSRLIVLPGARYDWNSAFGSHVNPSLNVMYKPAARYKVRGFVGRGYRAPSIKEQFFIFDHTAAGYVVYGGEVDLPDGFSSEAASAKLGPENSINTSLSVEVAYGRIGQHRLSVFHNDMTDLIDFHLLGFTDTYWRGVYAYGNVDEARTQGVEWESRIEVTPGVDLSLFYTWLDSENLDTGEALLGRPEHTAKILTSFEIGRGWSGSLWGNYHSRKLWVSLSNTGEQEEEPEWAPERMTWSGMLQREVGNIGSIYVRAENIFDETNVDYGYWPGFQVFTGIQLRSWIQP